MLKNHSLIFWVAVAISVIAGLYGLFSGRLVIFFPYALINPLALFLASALVSDLQRRRRLEFFSSLILLANLPGSVFFHGLGIHYDIPLHFLVALFAFNAIVLILSPRYPNTEGLLWRCFIIVFIGGVAFEGLQWLSDNLLGTRLFFNPRIPPYSDGLKDILVNTAGALTGLFIFSKKPRR